MGGLLEYQRTLAAGLSTPISARGKFLRVKDASGELTVTLKQNQLGDKAGESYSLRMRKFEKVFTPFEFDSVEVGNPEAADQVAVLMIGYGDFQSEIVSRTQAAQTFRTVRYHAQNPAGGLPPVIIAALNPQRKILRIKVILVAVLS